MTLNYEYRPLIITLCNLLDLEEIEVKAEDMKEKAYFSTKENCIKVAKDILADMIEVRKIIIHEYRHAYQIKCVKQNNQNEPLLSIWQEELKKDTSLMKSEDKMCLALEIDAESYVKYLFKKLYDITYNHYDKDYDNVLTNYIIKYFN